MMDLDMMVDAMLEKMLDDMLDYLNEDVKTTKEEVAEEAIEEVVEEVIVDDFDFINELDGFMNEETKKQKNKKDEKFEIPKHWIKVKEEPIIKDVELDLDKDGQLLKKWITRKIKKEYVFIKNEYMDYAAKKNISKSKAEKLLEIITENLELTKCWTTNFSTRQYPALKRTYTNAVYYK